MNRLDFFRIQVHGVRKIRPSGDIGIIAFVLDKIREEENNVSFQELDKKTKI